MLRIKIVWVDKSNANPAKMDLLEALRLEGFEILYAKLDDNSNDKNAAYRNKRLSESGIKLCSAYSAFREGDVVRLADINSVRGCLLTRLMNFDKRAISYTYENMLWNIPVAKANSRLVDVVVFPVTTTEKVWKGTIKWRAASIIPEGISINKFTADTLNFDTIRLLYVGRRVEHKGLGYLVDAFNILKSEIPIEMKIVSDVSYDQVSSFYSWSNVFCLPSYSTIGWSEQLGQSLIEAMASGKVVIGTDCGSIPEVIGNEGFIVPQRDSASIAAVIREIFHNPAKAKELGKAARRRVEERFNVVENAAKLGNLFSSLG